jgi:endonuclease YncB( thermonuclease family)
MCSIALLNSIFSIPEEQQQTSIVIDKDTYKRLLRACSYKNKEQLELEKQKLNEEKDRLIVR